jgi:putative membrane protein
MVSALLAAAHYLALAIGLGAVFMRGRYLRALVRKEDKLAHLFIADNLWGVAAVLWWVTGLLRAFGGYEKGSEFYLQSPLFWVKMALFGLAAVLEMWPMITFIRWRIAIAKKKPVDLSLASRFILLNDLEVAIILIIPFIASMMARGIGL